MYYMQLYVEHFFRKTVCVCVFMYVYKRMISLDTFSDCNCNFYLLN